MPTRAYISSIHPAWTIERQREMIGAADAEYVDEFGPVIRKRGNPAVLVQRATLFRPTARKVGETIVCASPACFAFSVRDFTATMAAAAIRGATIRFADTGLTIAPSVETPLLDQVVQEFLTARQRRGLHRSRGEIARERETDTKRRADLIRGDWKQHDHTTRDLLARAGVKPGKPMAPATALAHLGNRREAQADYDRAQAREAGRRAGRTPWRKPKP